MRQFRPRPLQVPERAHPLVKRLFVEMRRQRVGLADLAVRSGVSRETISAWRYRQSPAVTSLEACLGALGLRLGITDQPRRADAGLDAEHAKDQ